MSRVGWSMGVPSFVLGGWLIACSRSAKHDDELKIETRNGSVAEIRLSLPKGQFCEGEKIVATFELHNQTDHPLWINKRLAFNDRTVPPELRETWIDVKALDGGRDEPDCVSRFLLATDADYAVLPAGGVILSRDTVTCLNLSAGRYLLVAHYRDGNARAPYAPAGAVWLGKELWSVPVAVEIKKKDG
jgi:hypothetical protein